MAQQIFRLDVKESLLRWALERSNKSVDELASRSKTKHLNEWLLGTKKPTRLELEAFANATYTPFGYLLLPEPPQERPSPIPHFRTIKHSEPQKRSINLEDTIGIIERRQEWMRDYLIEVGAAPLEFVGSSKMSDDPIDVANKIRDTLGLVPDWTIQHSRWNAAQKHLLDMMEAKRIFVSKNSMVGNNAHRLLNPKEFRGFALVDNYAPFVFINGADFAGAQMFTLAHELAHVWMGKSASFDLGNLTPSPERLELACNDIAAEFLVSTKEISQHWTSFVESPDGPYKTASKHFKVSKIVVARRALDVGHISQEDFEKFYAAELKQHQEYKKQQKEQNGGPTPYASMPTRISKRFLRAVITAADEQKLLYRDAYLLTNTTSKTFHELKRKMEGGKF